MSGTRTRGLWSTKTRGAGALLRLFCFFYQKGVMSVLNVLNAVLSVLVFFSAANQYGLARMQSRRASARRHSFRVRCYQRRRCQQRPCPVPKASLKRQSLVGSRSIRCSAEVVSPWLLFSAGFCFFFFSGRSFWFVDPGGKQAPQQ